MKRIRDFTTVFTFLEVLKNYWIYLLVAVLLSGCATSSRVSKNNDFEIVNIVLSKQIKKQGNKGISVNRSTNFSTTDKEVVCHIQYANLFKAYKLRWEWIDPFGKVYSKSKNYRLKAPKDTLIKDGSLTHKMSIKEAKAAKMDGKWEVKVFLDDALHSSQNFIIKKPYIPYIAPNIDFGKFHALVIGNNKYEHLRKLKSANNDAIEIANLLKNEYGFTVDLYLNATRTEIVTALDELRAKMSKKHNLLIYYAGHGWLDEDANEGYWFPVDAHGNTKVNWISNASVTSSLRAMRAKHIMVIADSCYSGKLVRGLKVGIKSNDYLKKMARKRSRTVLTSGGLEPVLDSGGREGHSVFTGELIKQLKDNKTVLDGISLFSKIRRVVMLGADQTPEYSDLRKAGHDGGDFLFVKEKMIK